MSTQPSVFATFNAKKLSPLEVAATFVVPPEFRQIASADHCYLIGARGSGKTTLLRMMHGESLMAWQGRDALEARSRITFSTIFLPADELWASQMATLDATDAFTNQMYYAFLDACLYRLGRTDSGGFEVHNRVELSSEREGDFVSQCARLWEIEPRAMSILAMQERLDLAIGEGREGDGARQGLVRLVQAVRAFNRAVEQPGHRWALLMDEMELAPKTIHDEVSRFVRGGPRELILKLSMSPFDRYTLAFGAGGPAPGNDFQTVHLSGRSEARIASFTNGLWAQQLRERNLPVVPLTKALGRSTVEANSVGHSDTLARLLLNNAEADEDFAKWLRARSVDLKQLDELTYNERSATIRKVSPLLVFRNAVLTYRSGEPVRRSRKKLDDEHFTGARAITRALEGNPRWIRFAFDQMLTNYDPASRMILRGFQYDAVAELGGRFWNLLQVLPSGSGSTKRIATTELFDSIARFMHARNTGQFNPDPPNSFKVDDEVPEAVLDALVLGLYAGAFVHVRSSRGSGVLNDLRGERFRLTYLLASRERIEYPLRLGRAVNLSSVFDASHERYLESAPQATEQLAWDLQ